MHDLTPDEVRSLVAITTGQFSYWQSAIREHTDLNDLQMNALDRAQARDDWKYPDFLNWWFILTYLYTQKGFRAPKRDVIGWEWDAEEARIRYGLTEPPRPLVAIGPEQKLEVPGAIPGIGYNTARRYMGQLLKLRLIENVGDEELQLTQDDRGNGKLVVDKTVNTWHQKFGEHYERYLRRTGKLTEHRPATKTTKVKATAPKSKSASKSTKVSKVVVVKTVAASKASPRPKVTVAKRKVASKTPGLKVTKAKRKAPGKRAKLPKATSAKALKAKKAVAKSKTANRSKASSTYRHTPRRKPRGPKASK